VPLAFTATNLSLERAEPFYRAPTQPTPELRDEVTRRMRSVARDRTSIHDANPGLLRSALLASTAVPVFFDPVVMTFDGRADQLIDGGIADNTPVDIARTLARAVRTVIVDPANVVHRTYENAVEIDAASLGIAERRTLQKSLRSARLESEGAQLFATSAVSPEQRAFLATIVPAELTIVRPSERLSLGFADFDDQQKVDEAYARRFADGTAGFVPYEIPAAPAAS